MKVLGIIPARYASSRFPGKPLVVINGKTMIQRVYEQALKCREVDQVIVATDHETIRNHVTTFGGEVMMTSVNHRSGTERCAEIITQLTEKGLQFDTVVNIQGDEPFIDPLQISQLISCFDHPETDIATLILKIDAPSLLSDPNIVKVVTDAKGKAIYFSRSAIPYTRGQEMSAWPTTTSYYKHIGIYGYRADLLPEIVALPVAPPETAESLEQLRWLWHGYRIQTQITTIESIAIDDPADLLKITNKT
jgi:3-deoxy-manno-octulosonate cytidylyltransferase (CMP-KDO synthetase)